MRAYRQLTLALIKPDLYADPSARLFTILCQRVVHWREADAAQFYAVHKGKFYYRRLVDYMTSGPFMAMVLAGDNAIADWRSLIGPTHPVRAQLNAPHTLRARFGVTDTRNSFHGSDSLDNARDEIKLFFPELAYDEYVKVKQSV
ncbi:nucleoside diphosphate kinase [Ramicandelaber brevisporus]|nr:nucleoside diphosphate kinase [Ramicandelaber brevisporus]